MEQDTEINLENYSIWQFKPWWCQPWSILLTGGFMIGACWFLLHSVIVLGLVTLMVFLWWGYFLIFVPILVSRSLKSLKEKEAANQSIKIQESKIERLKQRVK